MGCIWVFCLSSRSVGVNEILDDYEIDYLRVGVDYGPGLGKLRSLP